MTLTHEEIDLLKDVSDAECSGHSLNIHHPLGPKISKLYDMGLIVMVPHRKWEKSVWVIAA